MLSTILGLTPPEAARLGGVMGEYAIRVTMAMVIAAAGVYSAWVHMKAGLAAERMPPIWKRLPPGLFYLAAALFLCNVVFAPGRFATAWLPEEARRRAIELSIPEKLMPAVLALAAAAVLAWDLALGPARRGRS